MKSLAPKNYKEEDKPKVSLIPLDLLIELLVPAYEEGIQKYKRESWRLGFTTTVMMDACLRHLISFFYDCEDYDKDSEKYNIKKHHLGAAIFCIICMYDTVTNHPEIDDRYNKNEINRSIS